MILDFIEKHKIAFVAICSVVLFAGYMGITGAVKASRDGEAGRGGVEQIEQAGPDEGDAAEDDALTKEMTAAQRAYVKDYDEQAKSIIAQLASIPWRGVDGRGHLKFTPSGAFTETLPANSDKKQVEGAIGSIAIVDVDGRAVGTSQDGRSTVTSFIGLLDDGTYAIFHLTRSEAPQADAPNPVMFLDSDALGGSYTSAYAWDDLDIQGVGVEVKDAVGGHSDKLETELSDYVKAYHSSCGTAAWDGTISFNYDMKTASIGFVLTSSVLAADGSPESEYIIMTYDMQNETFEGSEA